MLARICAERLGTTYAECKCTRNLSQAAEKRSREEEGQNLPAEVSVYGLSEQEGSEVIENFPEPPVSSNTRKHVPAIILSKWAVLVLLSFLPTANDRLLFVTKCQEPRLTA